MSYFVFGLIIAAILTVLYLLLAYLTKKSEQYKRARKLYSIGLWLSGFFCFIFLLFLAAQSGKDSESNPIVRLAIIVVLTMIFTGIGTISNLILGWRNDIRNKQETTLKIEKLELEIAELKSQKEEKEKIIINPKSN